MENNKKIVGYKLTKPEYKEAVIKICNYSVFDFKRFKIEVSEGAVEHLQKAGVLDLWFEPVYEQEEFKVGDWVTTTTDVSISYEKPKKGEVFQITEIKSEFVFFSSNGAVRNDRIRKATEEEIKKAQEYIELNKPKYSYNQIYDFIKKQESTNNMWYTIFKNLEELKK